MSDREKAMKLCGKLCSIFPTYQVVGNISPEGILRKSASGELNFYYQKICQEENTNERS